MVSTEGRAGERVEAEEGNGLLDGGKKEGRVEKRKWQDERMVTLSCCRHLKAAAGTCHAHQRTDYYFMLLHTMMAGFPSQYIDQALSLSLPLLLIFLLSLPLPLHV